MGSGTIGSVPDAPYLRGGREDLIFSPYFGNEGLGDFVRGSMYQGKWRGQFCHITLGIFMG